MFRISTICSHMDVYFSRWDAQVYRLCLLLSRSPADAPGLTFDAFLRLGAAKDAEIKEESAKLLLFSAAIRLCEDYFLRKPHRAPKREAFTKAMRVPVSDTLWALLARPFKARAALALQSAGFSPEQAGKMAGLHHAANVPAPDELSAVEAIPFSPEDGEYLSDRVYARFSERSVSFENKLHAAKSALDHAVPYLALLVLALFAFSVWVSLHMAA